MLKASLRRVGSTMCKCKLPVLSGAAGEMLGRPPVDFFEFEGKEETTH